MKKFLGLLIGVILLSGWGSLHAYELDPATVEQDQEVQLSTLIDWDALKTYAVATKKGGKGKKGGSKGKKGGNAKKGGSKGKKGGNAKKGGSKGKRGGKTRCVRVIRGKDGRIIRVIPCPPRRPKSGR